MATTTILGSEHDLALANVLLDVLREMGAEAGSQNWGVAGSQEINTAQFTVHGKRLTVETETYVGLSLTGDNTLVKTVVKRVRDRTQT